MQTLWRAAYWILPSLFCLYVYFWGLRAWYQQDDFVWLGQRFDIVTFHDLLHAIFAPSVHGTFRPLSERVFLLVAGSAFGADAFPARLLVMITQLANVLLLCAIGRRIFQSAVAGFVLPVLWVSNGALSFPMAWSSAYMYILCGFCILLAFYTFLRYIDTGDPRLYRLQWAVFLAGFLVMETMIVYPAIVTVYAFLRARRYFNKAAVMFTGSVAFLIFHSLYVPKQHEGTYSIHIDSAIPHTLLQYWKWVLVPNDFLVWHGWQAKAWTAAAMITLFTVAIAAYAICAALKGNRLPLFGVALFLILLAPVAPLKEHVSYYYLTLPSMGMAFVGAAAAASASRARTVMRVAAFLLIALFIFEQAPFAHWACKWWYERSQRIREVVMGTASVREAMPKKTLVLTDVDETLFAGAFWDHAFQAFGLSDIYADPSEKQALLSKPAETDLDLPSFFLDRADFQRGLLEHKIVVLSVAGSVPLDVTPRFEAEAKAAAPAWPERVNAASSLSDPYLRGTWYAIEETHRWMGKQAGAVMAAPTSPTQKLILQGYCSKDSLAAGPLTGHVTIDGIPAGDLRLTGEGAFEKSFPVPAAAVGKETAEVTVTLDHTFRPAGDGRDLGLVFGSFEIR